MEVWDVMWDMASSTKSPPQRARRVRTTRTTIGALTHTATRTHMVTRTHMESQKEITIILTRLPVDLPPRKR